MNRTAELAWAAGVVEGEGSIMVRKNGLITVAVNMTDIDVLERLRSITGVGRVTGPYKQSGHQRHWKLCYHWQVARQDDAASLLMTLMPFFGERRRAKAIESLATWRSRPISKHDATRRAA